MEKRGERLTVVAGSAVGVVLVAEVASQYYRGGSAFEPEVVLAHVCPTMDTGGKCFTPTPIKKDTPTPYPTQTPEATKTPKPTETPKPTATPKPTDTPVPTSTPTVESTATPSPTPRENGGNPTSTPTSTAVTVESPTPTLTPTVPTGGGNPTPTPTPERNDIVTPVLPTTTPTSTSTNTPPGGGGDTPRSSETPTPTSEGITVCIDQAGHTLTFDSTQEFVQWIMDNVDSRRFVITVDGKMVARTAEEVVAQGLTPEVISKLQEEVRVAMCVAPTPTAAPTGTPEATSTPTLVVPSPSATPSPTETVVVVPTGTPTPFSSPTSTPTVLVPPVQVPVQIPGGENIMMAGFIASDVTAALPLLVSLGYAAAKKRFFKR